MNDFTGLQMNTIEKKMHRVNEARKHTMFSRLVLQLFFHSCTEHTFHKFSLHCIHPMKNKRAKSFLFGLWRIIVMEILVIFSTLCSCFLSPFYVALENVFIEFPLKNSVGEENFSVFLFTCSRRMTLFDVYLFTRKKKENIRKCSSHEMTS